MRYAASELLATAAAGGPGGAGDGGALEVAGDGQPVLFTPEALDGLPEWADASRWRPTSTGGLIRADLDLASVPTWNDLDGELPAPCPRCDSLEWWRDGAGRRRCGRCDAEPLGRARQLAERAADLRRRHPPRAKPADGEPDGPGVETATPQAARGGPIAAPGDSEHVECNRP